MSSAAKAKGTAWETDLVRYLRAHGFPDAERRALAGALDLGDITGTPGLVWEAKHQRTFELAGWVDEAEVERINAGADYAAVVARRPRRPDPADAYVIVPLARYVTLVRQAGYGAPV